MSAIYQFCAGYTRYDAIANEAMTMRNIFRSWGCDSAIFSEARNIHEEMRDDCLDAATAPSIIKPDDIALLHLSIGSSVNEVFAGLKCRKAIRYHNITPPRFFQIANISTANLLEKGRLHLRMLKDSAEVNTAVSRFNASEMTAEGYRDVKVLPFIIDLKRLKSPPDRSVVREYSDGSSNILFVGRIAPNKKIEDVIKAFFYFKTWIKPGSRLIIAGSHVGTERYYHLLCAQAREYGIEKDVIIPGSVTHSQLNAYYECADLFLCMSEHEGFCVPIMEAMMYEVPVLAYSAAAVPETMDGAGVLFKTKDHPSIAEMMGRLIDDAQLRYAVIEKQNKRIERYMGRDLDSELKACLGPLLKKI